jgi:hypothetical protein
MEYVVPVDRSAVLSTVIVLDPGVSVAVSVCTVLKNTGVPAVQVLLAFGNAGGIGSVCVTTLPAIEET